MCGIAGVFRFTGPVQSADTDAVRRMMDAQQHRGPDDSGLYQDAHAVLGHRRLSIIDLSPAGRQPMSNAAGTIQIVYNGEIYDFKDLRSDLQAVGCTFVSQSDTEVMIHGYEQWGIEALLQKLRGMFAFALYDKRQYPPCLYLARDRFGIKPLYYASTQDAVLFASETKALIRSGQVDSEVNRDAVAGFLLFGSVPTPNTWYRAIRCLPSAHYALIDVQGCRESRFWQLRGGVGEAPLSSILSEAVTRHLLSDVPLGVFLSGGVDSTSLVALASRSGDTRLQTLTVRFNEPEWDESPVAREVAARFQTQHHEITITADDFIREVPRILEAMDQPTNDGVNTYFVSQAARRAGLTVVLSGAGGDEVFWGYPHYRWLVDHGAAINTFANLPRMLRRALVQSAVAYGKMRGQERWMRAAALAGCVSASTIYRLVRGFFTPRQVTQLLDVNESDVNRVAESVLAPSSDSVAVEFNRLEMQNYLHNQLLRDTDVFGMANSIEVRVPFLDHCVAEAVAAFSPLVKRTSREDNMNKPLLVHAVNDPLVAELSRRKKHSFTFPFTIWMHTHADVLQSLSTQSALLNRRAVRRLWTNFRTGRLHWSRAWAISALGVHA